MEELFSKFKRLETESRRAIEQNDAFLVRQIDGRMNRLWEELFSRKTTSYHDKKRMVSFLLEQIAPKAEPDNLTERCKKKILEELRSERSSIPEKPCKSSRVAAQDAASG